LLPSLASALKLLAAGSSEKLCYYTTWCDIPADANPCHSCEKPPIHSFQLSPLNSFVVSYFPRIYYMPLLPVSEYFCCYMLMVNRILPSIYSPSRSLPGSNPAEAVGFFGRKIPQHAFLRREVKPSVPCRCLRHVKEPKSDVEVATFGKISRPFSGP
jgi:hypothetical protein